LARVQVASTAASAAASSAVRATALAASGRVLVVVQTLDPAEAEFPFQGTVRLRALEGGAVVETDAETMRERYLASLAELTRHWRDAIVHRSGRFVRALTSDDLVEVVRSVVQSVR